MATGAGPAALTAEAAGPGPGAAAAGYGSPAPPAALIGLAPPFGEQGTALTGPLPALPGLGAARPGGCGRRVGADSGAGGRGVSVCPAGMGPLSSSMPGR